MVILKGDLGILRLGKAEEVLTAAKRRKLLESDREASLSVPLGPSSPGQFFISRMGRLLWSIQRYVSSSHGVGYSAAP